MQIDEKVDLDEMPQSRMRKKIAKDKAAAKKAAKAVDETYERMGNKIVKRVKLANGNCHTLFHCMVNKKNAAEIAILKEKGLLPKK